MEQILKGKFSSLCRENSNTQTFRGTHFRFHVDELVETRDLLLELQHFISRLNITSKTDEEHPYLTHKFRLVSQNFKKM